MKKTFNFFIAFLLSLIMASALNNEIAYADSGGDTEIEVTWTKIKKPSSKYSYPNCKEQVISVIPKRQFLGLGFNVKDAKGDVIGWHGTIILNMPENQINMVPIKFCYPLNLGKKVKNPLKLELFLKYSYLSPERGSTRILEIPYKFKK